MTVTPTGRVVRTASGADLVIDRLFSVSAEQMWAAVTESDRTAAWFGPWTGTGSAGNAIRVQMAFEQGEPWMDMTIEVCEAPSRYVVSSTDDFGSWLMEVQVAADGDGLGCASFSTSTRRPRRSPSTPARAGSTTSICWLPRSRVSHVHDSTTTWR